MRATIIGAGPVGTYLAWQLSKQGHDVTVLEEHEHIGKPVQCTGILTNDIEHHLGRKDLASITKARVTNTVVHGPNEQATIPLKTNYVIDNAAYCNLLAEKATNEGATINTNAKYQGNTQKDVTWKSAGKQHTKAASLLVGADGPASTVAKQNGLYGKRSFLTGVQAVMRVKDHDDQIHFYPHIGEYAWYCPAGEGLARIGVAARKGAKPLFDSFIKQFEGATKELQGGLVPLHRPGMKIERRYDEMTVQLIGDAALHIKNTTGGGIIPGTKAAAIHAQGPEHYARNLGKLNKELLLHYHLNKVLQRFSPKDWDKLITQTKDEEVQRVLKETNRDHITQLIPKLILAKPSLLFWSKRIIK